MNLPLNHNIPNIMHIDLNSCFAMIEQQANPFLRKKPIAVAAYATANGCILAPSIEAKGYGIKTGMRVRDARLLCPNLIVRAPDPSKYRDVHIKFRNIFRDYSPSVTPKSIDEAILDFSTQRYTQENLVAIAHEIKQRMKTEIGDWITCSVGLATNRALAKLGAGLHKPDGLDIITHKNLRDTLSTLKLIDICGIADKNEVRLNSFGIFTPVQFLDASEITLKRVFGGFVGYYWYMRLRGWEIDDVDYGRKSIGQQYALQHHTANPEELARLLMKLTEKMGRRLRADGSAAQGVHVSVVYQDYMHWHQGKKFDSQLYTSQELYKKVLWLFNRRPYPGKTVSKLAVSCFDLIPSESAQLGLFDRNIDKKRKVSDAMDVINDKYGEFVITPALMMGMDGEILDRIAFGRIRELEKIETI